MKLPACPNVKNFPRNRRGTARFIAVPAPTSTPLNFPRSLPSSPPYATTSAASIKAGLATLLPIVAGVRFITPLLAPFSMAAAARGATRPRPRTPSPTARCAGFTVYAMFSPTSRATSRLRTSCPAFTRPIVRGIVMPSTFAARWERKASGLSNHPPTSEPSTIFSRCILTLSSWRVFQSSASVMPLAFAMALTFARSTFGFAPKNSGAPWSSTFSPPTSLNISPIFLRSGSSYCGALPSRTMPRISEPSSGKYLRIKRRAFPGCVSVA